VRDINIARWLLRLGGYLGRGNMITQGGVFQQPALLLDAVEFALDVKSSMEANRGA